ncbi:hypothetical protein GCM10010404_04010 [Nonomuraea africana]|uniref:Uncharacterized protein n=1 Tax=Nonomuraea africana TaxID=46171 RepID=A0ABR9KB30_9ACTN|nr:hypothetical protein [Nonomuraea africana]
MPSLPPASFGWRWATPRDASMIEGEVEVLKIDALPQERVTGSSHRLRPARGPEAPRAEAKENQTYL